jgi:glycosyltransferase involved in cell wall biosynthesis
MKVTLIATVLDAAEHIGGFLADVAAQTRAPDEVVIVDGGSSDGTLEILRADPSVTVLVKEGANIARGRNVALAAATHDVIAVADADCAYPPTWLEELLRPLEAGADVAMGWYEPVIESFLQAVTTGHLPLDPSEVDEATFMPSGRSVACRREAIEATGGWPEWLPIGEDMWVDHRWRERGLDMRFAPEAVAGWHPRATLGAVWRQYVRYARGDARAGMYPERHAIRFATYAGLAVALASRRTWPRLLVLAGAAVYAGPQVRRARARLGTPGERTAAIGAVPAAVAFIDAAKMVGYLAGLVDRVRRQRS